MQLNNKNVQVHYIPFTNNSDVRQPQLPLYVTGILLQCKVLLCYCETHHERIEHTKWHQSTRFFDVHISATIILGKPDAFLNSLESTFRWNSGNSEFYFQYPSEVGNFHKNFLELLGFITGLFIVKLSTEVLLDYLPVVSEDFFKTHFVKILFNYLDMSVQRADVCRNCCRI